MPASLDRLRAAKLAGGALGLCAVPTVPDGELLSARSVGALVVQSALERFWRWLSPMYDLERRIESRLPCGCIPDLDFACEEHLSPASKEVIRRWRNGCKFV